MQESTESFDATESKASSLADAAKRRFLGGIGALAAALPAGMAFSPLADARPADEPVSSDTRWGMLIDTTKCSKGCTACVDACEEENGLTGHDRPLTDPQWIRKVELKHKVTEQTFSLPMPCQHCNNPPCVDVCPTGASFRRDDGIVLVDRHICIGCRYCMMACPYKARSFVHETLTDQKPHMPRGKGCVESCTFCVHRVDAGNLQPACVEACDKDGHKAMIFGDLKDPESELSKEMMKAANSQIRKDLGTAPGVFYRGIPT
ncbi:MAG: sulfate reduction electron transfer complex DsrMKJOP subunit DsrO [Gammaproteobacteria bacterium]